MQQVEAVRNLSVEPDNAKIEGPKQCDRSPRYQGNQAGGAKAFEHQDGRGLLSCAEIAKNHYRQERRDRGHRGPYTGNPPSIMLGQRANEEGIKQSKAGRVAKRMDVWPQNDRANNAAMMAHSQEAPFRCTSQTPKRITGVARHSTFMDHIIALISVRIMSMFRSTLPGLKSPS